MYSLFVELGVIHKLRGGDIAIGDLFLTSDRYLCTSIMMVNSMENMAVNAFFGGAVFTGYQRSLKT